jgi:hypothetical protein
MSVIVMLVTGTGDKVVYRLGRSKGRSRTQTTQGGPIRGRHQIDALPTTGGEKETP